MHKHDLILKLVRRTNGTKAGTARFVNALILEVTNSLKKRERVTITGFGTFYVKSLNKRKIHNIHTGKSLVVPAHKKVAFRPGKLIQKVK